METYTQLPHPIKNVSQYVSVYSATSTYAICVTICLQVLSYLHLLNMCQNMSPYTQLPPPIKHVSQYLSRNTKLPPPIKNVSQYVSIYSATSTYTICVTICLQVLSYLNILNMCQNMSPYTQLPRPIKHVSQYLSRNTKLPPPIKNVSQYVSIYSATSTYTIYVQVLSYLNILNMCHNMSPYTLLPPPIKHVSQYVSRYSASCTSKT